MSRNGIRIGLLGWFYVRSAPFFQPDPFGGVLGPSLAGKRPQIDQNFNLDMSFLARPLVSNAILHRRASDLRAFADPLHPRRCGHGGGSLWGGGRRQDPSRQRHRVRKYFASFFFFMDVLGSISMIFEISFMLGPAGIAHVHMLCGVTCYKSCI